MVIDLKKIPQIELKSEGEDILSSEWNENFNNVMVVTNLNVDELVKVLMADTEELEKHVLDVVPTELRPHVTKSERQRWDAAAGGEAQQGDWNETDPMVPNYIQNKIPLLNDGVNGIKQVQTSVASGENAIALGEGTIAQGDNQIVVGQYNVPSDDALFQVGSGVNNTLRKTVLSVGGNGNITILGTLVSGEPIAITSGGTNAKNASDARKNLGLGLVSTENVLPITKGGLNSETVEEARENIGLLYGTEEPSFVPATGEGTIYYKII